MPKSKSTPTIIFNPNPNEQELLNLASLKARMFLRDINAYRQRLIDKNSDYLKILLKSRLEANDISSEKKSDILYQFRILAKSRNVKNKYHKYMTPLEERQLLLSEYFKKTFNIIKKKQGIKEYTKKLVPNLIQIYNSMQNIEDKLRKYNSIIIKKRNLRNSFIDNMGKTKKKLPIVKGSSFHENNKSLMEKTLKIEEDKAKNNNTYDIDINKKQKNNDIKIHKIKILNRRNCNNNKNKYLYDKNMQPIVNTISFKMISKRGIYQHYNSIWRTKNIKNLINPYASDEISKLFETIKAQKKK